MLKRLQSATRNLMRHERKQKSDFYSPFKKKSTSKPPKIKFLRKDGNLLTTCNMLSVLQGLGPLAIPYAISIGGYLVIVNIIVIGIVMLYCNIILNRCQNKLDMYSATYQKGYTAVANHIWPRYGAFILSALQIIHFQLECVLYALLVSNLFRAQFYDVIGSKTGATLIAGLFLLPTMFFSNRKMITWLNFTSLLVSCIVFILLIGNALLHVETWHYIQIPVFSKRGFWIANCIVLFSFSVHPYSLRFETQMKHPGYFNRTSTVSFCLSIIFKLIFGIILAVYIGSNRHEIIINNFESKSFKLLLNCCLAFIGYYSFALPSASIAYLIEHLNIYALDYIFPSSRHYYKLEWREQFAHIMIRAVILFVTILIAVFVPDFCLIAALVGSSTTSILCVLLPCWFYCKLTKGNLCLNLVIIVIGTLVAIIGVLFILWRMHDVINIRNV